MDKLKMHSPDLSQSNISKIRALFPNCVTEVKSEAAGDNGQLKLAIDFDQLKQELTDSIVEGPQERYQLNWPGKQQALLTANSSSTSTFRPISKESRNFDNTENLYIEGNNLIGLKLLQEAYLNKIKLIYVDPPYNTGGDFIYEDNFSITRSDHDLASGVINETKEQLIEGETWIQNSESHGRYHSKWLSMIYERMLLARNLLTDDGIIVVSIDENEHVNLRKIMDLVFGEQNFAGEIVWKNSSKNDQKYVSIQHEYIVIYVRDKSSNKGDWTEKKEGLRDIYAAFDSFKAKHGTNWQEIHNEALKWFKQFPASNPISNSKHYSWMDEKGVYFPDNISGPNDGQYVYDVIHPETKEVCKMPSSGWRYPEETLKLKIMENTVHFGKDHTTVPNNKTYLKNTEYQSLTSMRFVDGRSASKRLQALFGEKVFTNPKDELLLKDLFKAFGVKDKDIILDFFAGSSTTAHATFELNKEQSSNCHFILIQWPESLELMNKKAKGGAKKVTKNAINYLKHRNKELNICEIGKERIRLVSESFSAEQDTGFRVLKIDSSNMTDVFYRPDQINQTDMFAQVVNIKEDRTDEDLLFQLLLDWGVGLTLPISKQQLSSKDVFFVNADENGEGADLIACFGKDISNELIKALAEKQPLRVVFRDDGFANDSVKINVEQIFKQISPMTDVKSI